MQKIAKKQAATFHAVFPQEDSSVPRIGTIIEVTESKGVMVDFIGNQFGPLTARIISNALSGLGNVNIHGASVLLLFEKGDVQRPIIVGVMQESLSYGSDNMELLLQEQRPSEGLVDGEVLRFDADSEIILQCGKSSITLMKDGKIILKGTKLISRSSGENKIKGATVSIN